MINTTSLNNYFTMFNNYLSDKVKGYCSVCWSNLNHKPNPWVSNKIAKFLKYKRELYMKYKRPMNTDDKDYYLDFAKHLKDT